MKKFIFLPLFLVFSIPLFSQKIIDITYEKEMDGVSYIFECQNNSFINYTVTIEFTTLTGYSSDVSFPYQTTVGPGKSRLFRLKPFAVGTISPNFSYRFNYRKGCLNTKIDTNFAYLLPISPLKTTKAQELFNISERYFNTSPPKDWYSLSFKAAEGDTVFAARKGIVGELVSNQKPLGEALAYKREVNFVEIQHEDCTFGRYELFKENGIFVKEGDVVQAGQPLGIINSNNFLNGNQLRFSVYYAYFGATKKDKKTEKSDNFALNAVSTSAYVPVHFWVENQVKKLAPNSEYTAEHPDILVTKEMSKKEKKRRIDWLKKNTN